MFQIMMYVQLVPLPPTSPSLPHLSTKGQEIVVEVHVGHDVCEILRVLTFSLLQLQEHLLTTQHERQLLADQPGVKEHTVTFNLTAGMTYEQWSS